MSQLAERGTRAKRLFFFNENKNERGGVVLPRTREKNRYSFTFKKTYYHQPKAPPHLPLRRERKGEREMETEVRKRMREKESARRPEREDSQRSFFFFFPVLLLLATTLLPKRSRHEKINGKGLSSGAVYIYICFHRFTSSRETLSSCPCLCFLLPLSKHLQKAK